MASHVSIIVPAHNAGERLAACLGSLNAQRAPHPAYELIVVDDASTDGTPETARRFGAQLISAAENVGSYSARNLGGRSATGEILAFIDADCVADPDWLREGTAPFSEPTVGCVAGDIEGVRPGTTWVERYQLLRAALSQERALQHPYLPFAQTANAFYRKSVWLELGGFEERWLSGGDADMTWRMLRETASTVVSARGAVVHHQHRRTVAALCAQSFRHGVGHAALRQRYRGEVEGLAVGRAAYALSRAGLGIASAALRGDKSSSRLDAMGASWLDILQIISNRAGVATGSLLPRITKVGR